jgi:hypothetical protein
METNGDNQDAQMQLLPILPELRTVKSAESQPVFLKDSASAAAHLKLSQNLHYSAF